MEEDKLTKGIWQLDEAPCKRNFEPVNFGQGFIHVTHAYFTLDNDAWNIVKGEGRSDYLIWSIECVTVVLVEWLVVP